MRGLEYKEQTAKLQAQSRLEKARKETGVSNPANDPQLMEVGIYVCIAALTLAIV